MMLSAQSALWRCSTSLLAMETTSHSVKGDVSVRDIFKRLKTDLKYLPEEETTEITEPPKPKDVDGMTSLPVPDPLGACMVEVRKEGDKDKKEKKENDDDEDGLAAKEVSRDFINQAKAQRRNAARKKENNIEKQA